MTRRRSPQLPKAQTSERGRAAQSDRVQLVRRLIGEGAALLSARRAGEAARLLEEAWQLDPQNVPAAINLGGAYILQGRHAKAVPVLEAASALEPDNAMIWSNLGAAYLGKIIFATAEGQERAIFAYERALALDARAPHVHYNLGLIYLQRGDLGRAEECFRVAVETDPHDSHAKSWLEKIGRDEINPSDLISE